MRKKITINQQLEKINIIHPDSCWLWRGYCNKDGYGTFMSEKTTKFAHRLMWERSNNKSAKDLIIRHSCDNPPCCNPLHLVGGSQIDNVKDRQAKNRQAKGEKSGGAKLTSHQVLEIRNNYSAGKNTYKEMAALYQVSYDLIYKIINRKLWKHLEGYKKIENYNHFRKLTESQVLEIRTLALNGMSKINIGKNFNVGRETIRAIVIRRTWKHI